MPLHVSSTVVLIIRRSKLYYTASDIITTVSAVSHNCELLMMSTQCSKHVEEYNKLIIKQEIVH